MTREDIKDQLKEAIRTTDQSTQRGKESADIARWTLEFMELYEQNNYKLTEKQWQKILKNKKSFKI